MGGGGSCSPRGCIARGPSDSVEARNGVGARSGLAGARNGLAGARNGLVAARNGFGGARNGLVGTWMGCGVDDGRRVGEGVDWGVSLPPTSVGI